MWQLLFCGKPLIVLHLDIQPHEPLHQLLWAALTFQVAAVPADPAVLALDSIPHFDVPPLHLLLLLHFRHQLELHEAAALRLGGRVPGRGVPAGPEGWCVNRFLHGGGRFGPLCRAGDQS